MIGFSGGGITVYDSTNSVTFPSVQQLTMVQFTISDQGNGALYVRPMVPGSTGALLYCSSNNITAVSGLYLQYGNNSETLRITNLQSNYKGLVVRAASSQSVNLTEWQNSSTAVGARITSAVQFSNSSVDATTEQFGAGVSMASSVTFSLAVGTVATLATGVSRGVAVGYGASVASGTWYATAVGYLAQVSVTNDTSGSTAIGAQANVTGAGGTAIGRVATAGVVGTAIGYGTTAGQQAVAIGNLATATTSAVAIGDSASASSSNSLVIGRNCSAPGGIAMGYQATSSGQGDVAFCTAGDGNNEDARLTMFAASAPLFNNPKRQWRLWGTWADNSALGYKGRLRGMVCDATSMTGIEAWRIESNGTYGLMSIGGAAVTSSTALTVVSPTAAYTALVVKGATSQSADIFQARNVSETVLAGVSSTGRVFAGGTPHSSIPAAIKIVSSDASDAYFGAAVGGKVAFIEVYNGEGGIDCYNYESSSRINFNVGGYNGGGNTENLKLWSRNVNVATFDGNTLAFNDGLTIATGTTTGTKIGTATTQKLAFWNATPVVQQVLATGAAHTVDDVITFLQTVGLCKQS